MANKDTDVNDLAEKSWQEIQSAFGSGTTLGGKLNIPAKIVLTGMGFNLERLDEENLAQKSDRQNLNRLSQK